ncbi:MAG: phosphate ABC transporter, permease protein PstA, partial [Flavobacteriales bacterium]|nr:phosphate ABC transporter, permease protein PstA [Flavobacteriales bacterium]
MNKTRYNRLVDRSFRYVGLAATVFGLLVLGIFLVDIVVRGIGRINWQFLSDFPSYLPEQAGILPALVGTLWMLVLTAVISIPIGIAAGIYLEEYGKRSKLAYLIEVNIANLAGVPSIIYGLLGLEIFVRLFGMGN